MNQQTSNSNLINSSSGPSTLSTLPATGHPTSALVELELPSPNLTKRKLTPARSAAEEAYRCRHYTSTGRRCRLAVLDPASGLCFRHVGRQFQPSDEDLSPAFVGLLSGFQSPSRIHDFLTQVTVLLVQNRISTRRAAILVYLGQTLLRTLPAIELELGPPQEEQQIIFDLPRPNRD